MKNRFFNLKIFFFLLCVFIFSGQAQELSKEKVKKIEQMISAKMSKDRIPAVSIAIVLDGKLVWSNGFGFADIENFSPAKSYSAYRSASIGKTITATAVMQLVEKGKINIDAPIQTYCPAFPRKRWTITTKHLLAHTSGIRHYGGENNAQEILSNKHYENVIEPLEIFKNDPLLFEPGKKFGYSTYGYNVLGCVVEGASGMNFMDYLSQNIFQPAGMENTRDDDPFAIIANRSKGYRIDENGKMLNSTYVDMSNKMPAGGYITTVEDLALFASAVMNGTLIKPETFEKMLTPQKTNSGETIAYGLGWGLFPGENWYGEKEAFHGGITPQVSGMLYMLPGRNFAVAMQMNLEGVSGRTGLAAEIAKVALDLGEKNH